MFVPVQIRLGAGGESRAVYDRSIEMTSRQMEAFERAAGNMTEPLTAVGQHLRSEVAAAFQSEGATGASGRWQPLSPTYGAWKEKHSPGTPILIGLTPMHKGSREHPNRRERYSRSGEMKRQLLDPLAIHVGPRRLLYAPMSDIAGYHETGTSKMPARPPVELPISFLHEIDRVFVRWLGRLIADSGL